MVKGKQKCKSSNKDKSQKQSSESNVDVTLNDFANNEIISNRTSKAYKANLKVQDITVDDFVIDDAIEEESHVKKEVSSVQSSCEGEKENIEQTTDGITYPIDIWFLLAKHIQPDAIKVFSCICKRSYAVTCTRQFWKSIYNRYQNKDVTLPERLHPGQMLRHYSLKANVIRFLFYTYNPLVQRSKNVTTFNCDPDVLLGCKCCLIWYKNNSKSQFEFCFKFEKHAFYRSSTPKITDDNSFLANPDCNYRVLKVSAEDFMMISPLIHGKLLTKAALCVSNDMKHHKLKLGFSTYMSRKNGSNEMDLILDQLINVQILEWWHPLFPAST